MPKFIPTFLEFLNESVLKDPSTAALQDCKALFSSYANVTNNKSSLQKIYKRKNDPFIKQVLEGQYFPKGPLYRGIVNRDNLKFEEGDFVNFGFDGWSEDINIASEFTGISKDSEGKRVLFVMNDIKGLFINLMSFGQSLEKEIQNLRPKFDFKNPNLIIMRKASENDPILEKLFDVYHTSLRGKFGRGESETITEPQKLKIIKIEEREINIDKLGIKNTPVKIIYV